MASKTHLIRKLLKGIETGDPAAASVVNETRYIQHNPQTREGGEGLAALFARLARTDPKVTFVRMFEDGDFVFAHNEYDFASVRVAFEVFRFEGEQAVEHWDNIQPLCGPNPSSRGMLDGVTQASEHERTEANRRLVQTFVERILIARELDRIGEFVAVDLIQHDPQTGDGLDAWQAALAAETDGEPRLRHDRLHRVLAEGNFALCMIEGRKDGVHSGLYELFRVADGQIVERWNTVEAIAPRELWKNQNGKF